MVKSAFLLGCLLAYFVGSTLGGVVHLSGNTKMSVSGSATLKFSPPESLWTGLSAARRFPIILSGDLIALRMARSSGTPYWLRCSKSGDCDNSKCPGAHYITAAKFKSCRREVFRIRAYGKLDGQPVDSSDHVTLSFPFYAENRYFYCHRSTSGKCRATYHVPSWSGNNWLYTNQATFRIFSRNAVDGRPIQLGDTVGFKYSFQSYNAWLQFHGNRFYARPCGNGHYNKYSCAKINTATGFQIFKKL